MEPPAAAVLQRELARLAAWGACRVPARFAVRALGAHAVAEHLLADVDCAIALDEAIAEVAARGNQFLPSNLFCLREARRCAADA
jgi:hypothetical protein